MSSQAQQVENAERLIKSIKRKRELSKTERLEKITKHSAETSSEDSSSSDTTETLERELEMGPEEFARLLQSPIVGAALKQAIGIEALISNFDEKFEEVKTNLKEKDSEIADLKEKVDALDQQTRAKTLRIMGLPEVMNAGQDQEGFETTPTTLEDTLIKFFKDKLQVDIPSYGIQSCFRLGKKEANKCRPILVNFTNEDLKAKVYRSRIKLQRKQPPVFLNEDLTPTRAKLFAETRKLVKDRKLNTAWTQNGKVCMKETATSKVLTVQNIKTLEKYRGPPAEALGAPGTKTYSNTVADATAAPPGDQRRNNIETVETGQN